MAPTTKLFLFTVIVIPLFLLPFCCGCIHSERDALLQFKAAINYTAYHTNPYSPTDLSSWEKGGDCCLWDGISCHNTTRHVVSLDIQGYFFGMDGGVISKSLCTLASLATISLSQMGLKGTLPPCLGKLSSLTELDLYSNRLSGNIPLSSSLAVLDLSSNNFEGETVFATLCLLSNLTVVNLSDNQLNGSIPSCLGNLTSLTELLLSNNRLSGNIPLSSSLAVLDLSSNNFEGETVLATLCLLSNLSEVYLSSNQLNGSLPYCLGTLSSLAVLDLSSNNFEGETVLATLCLLSNLSEVNLSENQLNGSLPSCLGNLSSLSRPDISGNHLSGKISLLKYLYVSSNSLSGSIPDSLSNLSLLEALDVSYNQLSGGIPDSLGRISLLNRLDVSYNQLSGGIPDSLGRLSLLNRLDLSYNQLNGTLPYSFSRLYSLTALVANGNAFNQSIASSVLPSSLQYLLLSLDGQQMISEAFFHNLTELKSLVLSNCVLNISTTWIPLFQLTFLYMTACKVDDQIPMWISTQFSLEELELVDNNLVGEIPSWLLDMNLLYINLTKNQLQGTLLLNTSAWNPLAILDVSRNALSGQIPSIWPPNIIVLLLNDNFLTGNIPPHLQGISSLEIVNLANNHLNGIIPPSLANCSKLQNLNLGNNSLRGMIPYDFGKLSELQSLLIKNNQLSGSFPAFISNCTKLYLLDVGQNSFKGHIPKSIGNLSELKVLAMRKNNFEGNIPAEIGQLKNLQILDLSSNLLSGLVPNTIFNLHAMLVEIHKDFSEVLLQIDVQGYVIIYRYKNGLNMNSKGRDEHYIYIFPTMMAIDLSNNRLNGGLPFDLGKLKGLKLLNLSMNNFSGAIPNSIVQLTWLESLDLSTNHFSGQIPSDLGSLSYLGTLNFSNNHLSGSIPQGGQMETFNELSYLGNPNLWGCPLPKKCFWPQFASSPPISTSINEEEQRGESVGYDIGVGLSYVAGFTTVLVFIVLKKKYFERVDLVLKIFFPWLHNLTL